MTTIMAYGEGILRQDEEDGQKNVWMGGRDRRDWVKVEIIRHSKSTFGHGSLNSNRLDCDRTLMSMVQEWRSG